MQFKFIGNPATSQGKKIDAAGGPITAHGIVFPAGKFIDVEDENIIAKLEGNSHFESKGS